MNIVITIVAVIAAIIVLLLLVALVAKKDYSLSRDITIDRPVGEVFNYIKHLKNQDQFSKWVMMDPNKKKSYRGTDGTVGFVYAWSGNQQAGEGEQEIVKISEGERVDIEVRFVRPFASIAQTPFLTKAVSEGQTQVTWGMSSAMKYPMNIMLLFVNMNKLLGADLEISLGNLKNVLESK